MSDDYDELLEILNRLYRCSCEYESLMKIKNLDDHRLRIRAYRDHDKDVYEEEFLSSFNKYISRFNNFEQRKYIAGRFIFMVMNVSVDKKNNKKKNLFKNEGLRIICAIVKDHPISEHTRKSVDAYIKKNMVKGSLRAVALKKLEPKSYKNPIEGKNIDSKDVLPSFKLINDYVRYIYGCALDYNTANISALSIFELLKKNTSMNGMDIIQPTIFEEAKKIKAINKKLVLDVAKTYADSIDSESNYYGMNNIYFDKSMEKMFCHIVTNYGYNYKEVEELKQTLINNSQDQEFVKRMAQNIGAAYISIQNNMQCKGR